VFATGSGLGKRNMEKDDLLGRIVINPDVMVGKPVIRGTRLTVQYILGLLASGAEIEEIVKEYDGLSREDVLACIRFASETLESTSFVPLSSEAG